MSSDAFMKGFSIFTMLQMSFISGAMFKISPSSVQVVPPVLGSSLAEIVPPVIIIAMLGNCLLASPLVGFAACCCLSIFSRTVASRISPSRIPMLYPDSSFRRIISESWDWRA